MACAISTPGCCIARWRRRCSTPATSPSDEARAIAAAEAIDPARFDEAALKRYEVGEAASVVSAIPGVRAALFDFQQEFAAAPPGAVLDGRDIGTVICPNADVKIFVTATPEVRAGRRANELRGRGETVNEADVLADILRRDERDRSRAAAPLMQAPDAHLLDTTSLDIEAAFAAAVRLIDGPLTERHRGATSAHGPIGSIERLRPSSRKAWYWRLVVGPDATSNGPSGFTCW